MKFLFFDCETTGVPLDYKASYEDIGNWPRVTQLAWMLCDEDQTIITQFQTLIKPDGWEVPKEKFFIDNNMSTERCESEGMPIKEVLEALMLCKQQGDFLVAHNLNFDHRVVWCEFVRAGIPPRSGMQKICTMMKSTKHCQLPNANGRGGFKWPKLQELHQVLFKTDFEGAHDALDDVIALKNCFFELMKLGVIVPELPVALPASESN